MSAWAEPGARRSRSLPSLERGTGHARLAQPATRGKIKDTAVRRDREMAILPQRVNFDWPA